MGESIDGSPSAARRAQPDEMAESEETGGFFRRVLGIFNPQDETEETVAAASLAGGAVPGMGNLHNMAVEDVAIPKAEIVAVPVDIGIDDLVQVFRESGMTRLPVYEGTLDTPLGMVHLKDFALRHGFNGKGTPFALRRMLRQVLYVPPSMPIGVLLQKMQAERRHMALVIDEYGGVDGLVTIEDLIEQVVGQIEDEHDTEDDALWTEEAPGCYVALAKTPLDMFEAEIGLSLTEAEEVDEEEIDTLGGLVFMLLGRVPVRGEVIEHPAGPVIEVLEADPRRIKRVRVRLRTPENG
ncbi:transporter associated domain-containing protein [Roseovarius autotrophicus]|uniref:transporter associated domain-containing protein n=1 Tax=Roseovarius autotrophicus TaxID=2824121 RepID=UPI0019E4D9B9|nr:hemolysin family protein [Roseovarius autotrophicus]MBE0454537.1 HlyC/CorC family transporter [Roseovarius sp.]